MSSASSSEPALPAPKPVKSGDPAAAEAPDRLPRFFGRYQLFDRIGRGGMANIYLARAQSELGGDRLVVVKQILPHLSSDEAFAKLFIAEAKLCAGLRHQNVVQVIDLGREGDLLYMAMEYVEGFDLNALLGRLSRAKVPLALEYALFVVREVLSALDVAHRFRGAGLESRGIVHRDVSPSNVLLSFEGEVKLCDFGIARAAGETSTSPSGSRVVGKSAYMSPEQALGQQLDGRADVFAAGILLWELAAGRRLYKGSEEQMLQMARAAQIPRLPERGLPNHALLQSVLDRALAPDPSERFESAAAMRDALDGYVVESRLIPSQIRFGEFLAEHFGHEFVLDRRARERAARALAMGPAVVLEAIAPLEPSAEAPRDDEDTDEQPLREHLDLSSGGRVLPDDAPASQAAQRSARFDAIPPPAGSQPPPALAKLPPHAPNGVVAPAPKRPRETPPSMLAKPALWIAVALALALLAAGYAILTPWG